MKNLDFEVLFNNDFKLRIKELVFYITYKFSDPNAGYKLKNKLLTCAKSLSIFPERHPVMFIEKSTGYEVRKFIVGKYIITYFVDDKNKIVHINNLLISK